MHGVLIDGPSQILGDNESVVTSFYIPSSKLNKNHNAINYNLVREAVSKGVIFLTHITGKYNPSNLLTKTLGPQKHCPLIN